MAHNPRHDLATIPVVEEQAIVRKRKKLTGGVRVHTVVHHDEVVVDEPLATEQVEVQRVVLDRWVTTPVPIRHEGDTGSSRSPSDDPQRSPVDDAAT